MQPILAELALLEWTLAEVFDAADAEPCSAPRFPPVEPSAWSELNSSSIPRCAGLTFSWNTAAVWKAMSSDETPPRPERASAPLPWLLWRQNLQNYFRSMNAVKQRRLMPRCAASSFGRFAKP